MAIYHLSIKIIGRSGGRSAVAAAAYRAGERLTNEETGLTHDFTHKSEVAYSEILLPENAPSRLYDRSTLWNEVQREENTGNAQFAREIEVALPLEIRYEDKIKCVHDYVQKNFVDEGMIADWSLHDKEDNPHAHILLSVRSFDENGQWNNKKKSFWCNDFDEMGRAIYNPNKPCYDPKDKENTSMYKIPKLDKKKIESWENMHNEKFDILSASHEDISLIVLTWFADKLEFLEWNLIIVWMLIHGLYLLIRMYLTQSPMD